MNSCQRLRDLLAREKNPSLGYQIPRARRALRDGPSDLRKEMRDPRKDWASDVGLPSGRGSQE
eukprot:5697828-Pyramimonas_sp.AAC.1